MSEEEILGLMWKALKHLDGWQEHSGPLYLELEPTGAGGIYYIEWAGRHMSNEWVIHWDDLEMAEAELKEYL